MNKHFHGKYQKEYEEQEMTLLADEERNIKNRAMMLFMKTVLCDSLSALAELNELIENYELNNKK